MNGISEINLLFENFSLSKIYLTFEIIPLNTMKLWIKHYKNIIKNKIWIKFKFVKTCIRNNVISQHLKFLIDDKIKFSYFRSQNKLF